MRRSQSYVSIMPSHTNTIPRIRRTFALDKLATVIKPSERMLLFVQVLEAILVVCVLVLTAVILDKLRHLANPDTTSANHYELNGLDCKTILTDYTQAPYWSIVVALSASILWVSIFLIRIVFGLVGPSVKKALLNTANFMQIIDVVFWPVMYVSLTVFATFFDTTHLSGVMKMNERSVYTIPSDTSNRRLVYLDPACDHGREENTNGTYNTEYMMSLLYYTIGCISLTFVANMISVLIVAIEAALDCETNGNDGVAEADVVQTVQGVDVSGEKKRGRTITRSFAPEHIPLLPGTRR